MAFGRSSCIVQSLAMTTSFNTRVKTGGTPVPFYLTWLPRTQARYIIRRIMSARLRFRTLFAHFV